MTAVFEAIDSKRTRTDGLLEALAFGLMVGIVFALYPSLVELQDLSR